MRVQLLPVALLAACGRPADDAPTDTDPLVKACDVELDETAYVPDPRLVRWPYTSHVTSTGVTVQWGLPIGTTGTLHYGPDGNLGTTADAVTDPLDDLVEALALHKVRLDGLEPDTSYCYRIEIDGEDVSGPLTFRTAPPPESTDPVRFLVLGDYGTGIGLPQLVLDQIKPHYGEIDFWLTTGDNAYGSGTAQEWQNNIFLFYRDLLRRVPYFPVAGNHDYDNPLGLQPMLDSVDLPQQAYRVEDHGRYYSFDWGLVHVSALDSELAVDQVTPGTPDDDMVDWLEDDLTAAADRPWRFAAWHHPAYMTEPGRSAKASVREHLVPAVEAGNVPLVLQGHSHVYEAFLHLQDGAKLESGGTSYVITGGGGAPRDAIDGEEHAAEQALRDYGQAVNHFLLVEVTTCTTTARAIDLDGNEIHRFTLTRPCEET